MTEITQKMCQAGIWAYEEAMGGDRLPDGDGYDEEVVKAIFLAMLKEAEPAGWYRGDVGVRWGATQPEGDNWRPIYFHPPLPYQQFG